MDVLSEIMKEIFLMRNMVEFFIWQRSLGHLNFDNLFKISSKKCVKSIMKIIKPTNTLWNACQHGEKTRRIFKSKEYSTSVPLEIIHTNLCGPIRIKSIL